MYQNDQTLKNYSRTNNIYKLERSIKYKENDKINSVLMVLVLDYLL